MTDIEKLKALALAAGSEKWRDDGDADGFVWGEDGDSVCICHADIGRIPEPVFAEQRAAYIAAANPAAVLELIAEVERLRAELAARCRAEGGDTFNSCTSNSVVCNKSPDLNINDGCAAPAAGTVKDAELADALNTTLWLYRRLPHAYGKPPFVDKAILTMAARLGLDDVPAAIKERAAIEAHTKAAKENA